MPIPCPNCQRVLPQDNPGAVTLVGACPGCRADLEIAIFPALFRAPAHPELNDLLAASGESPCYEHANKKAVAICSKCGRFLCALCEVKLDSKIWCPSCVVPDAAGNTVQVLERRRTLYDSIALALATLPMLLGYLSLLTAPVVIYLGIRHWKTPSSIVPRGKWRFVVAVAIASLELLALIAGVMGLLGYFAFGGLGKK